MSKKVWDGIDRIWPKSAQNRPNVEATDGDQFVEEQLLGVARNLPLLAGDVAM